MKTIIKSFNLRAIFAALLLVALIIGSALLQPTASQAQLNAPSQGTNSGITIDAGRIRAYQGGTNATAGVTTNFALRVTSIGLTNTFTIINGIITAVSTP
jgi:hypothetical protein